MVNLTKKEVQQAYADSINILFAGAVNAQADQITPEVIAKVDSMIIEIAKCSENMTKLSFELIFGAVKLVVINPLIDKYVDNFFVKLAVKAGVNKAKQELEKWVQALMSNRRHIACIVTARANWRSAIEIELLGL